MGATRVGLVRIFLSQPRFPATVRVTPVTFRLYSDRKWGARTSRAAWCMRFVSTEQTMRLPVHGPMDEGSRRMPVGNIKWFDNRKGFGFIASETGEDIFVHYKNITGEGFRSLNDGDTVNYEVIQGPKGMLAQNVRVISSNAPTVAEFEAGA